MPKYSTCIFCNTKDSRSSTEHILPTWIAKEFPDVDMFEIEEMRSGKLYRSRGHLGVTTNKVCVRCNTGWMHELEDAAKPYLITMMHGHTITLRRDAQSVIARWCLKTFMMLETFRIKTRPQFFQDSERLAFYEDRETPKMVVLMFLARYVGNLPITAQDWFMGLLAAPDSPHPIQIDCYTATLTIKQFATQIFAARWPEESDPAFSLKFRIPGGWDRAVISVLPFERTRVWPPQQAFDNDVLELFAKRFGSAVP